MLKGKKIILGVTGSIAAYKTPELVRQLIKKGAEVKVITTTAALDFVSPLVLSTVSKNAVHSNLFDDNKSWQNHVELGLWADCLLIAPASANTLAKLANGICDNLLLATYLSSRCKVLIAPAMDVDMYLHPATQKNIEQLKSFSNLFIGPATGELASGLSGEGRMEEPETIVNFLDQFFSASQTLKGKRIVITAGPTREPLDPVRFLSNHSTGKMGVAIADEAHNRGGAVTLILGKGAEKISAKSYPVVYVDSADEMLTTCKKDFTASNIFIMSAAVADYTPADYSDIKIKKKTDAFEIKMKATTDVLATLGKSKKKNQFLVGFALETNDELKHAQQKLERKNLDMIVLNSLQDAGAGFATATNKITIIHRNNTIENFSLKSKADVAADILNSIEKYISQK
ncbi:MAG: bifunctional phosphopantothenoylcysteine decarboxylase/phosphopantothenate--cysteine ligase CoaBC [Bacteroidia bacterium]